MTFKCINNLAPTYLRQFIIMKDGLQSLRGSYDYFLVDFPPLPKPTNGHKRFSYAAPLEWNKLPYELRTSIDITYYILYNNTIAMSVCSTFFFLFFFVCLPTT